MKNKVFCPRCNSTEMGIAIQVMEGQLHQATVSKTWIGSVEKLTAIGRLNHVICKNCGVVVYSFAEGYENLK